MDEQIRIILIILISVSIFGLLATFALGAQKLLPAMQQLYASLTTIRLFCLGPMLHRWKI